MSILGRWIVVLGLAVVGLGLYSLKDLNAGLVRNGCTGGAGLNPSAGSVHFSAFPPHFFCRYTLKNGRHAERSS